MNILQVNKYNYIKGGAERYYIDLCALLKRKGHKVARFSMKDDKNLPSEWEEYFISNISFKNPSIFDYPKMFGRMFYSLEAKRKIGELLDDFKPDIVHVHNIYNHISPSILVEIKKREIPVVCTIHDYFLLSPNVTLFHNGKVCELAKSKSILKMTLHRCINNSLLQSLGGSFVWRIHHSLKLYYKYIDILVAPSEFMKEKLIEYGIRDKKIEVLPYFLDTDVENIKTKMGHYVLYFGKVCYHKGVGMILDVAEKLPDINIVLAGGDWKGEFQRKAQKRRIKNIRFLGFVEKKKLGKLIENCALVIIPSLWYENFPFSILESLALGKPVIASKIGGIPEIVEAGRDGLLFEPGNVEDLVKKVLQLWNNPELVLRLGRQGREDVERKYNPKTHYKELMKVYHEILN